MSRERDKQVDEALAAIRKLVEGEDKPASHADQDDGIVTLDKVVWRNPSKDKEPFDEPASADVPAILMPEEAVVQKPLKGPAPDTSDLSKPVSKTEDRQEAEPSVAKRPLASAGSISPRDIALITELKTPIARKGDALFAQDTNSIPEDAPAWPAPLPQPSQATPRALQIDSELSTSGPEPVVEPAAVAPAPIVEDTPELVATLPREPVSLTDVVDKNPFAVPERDEPSLDIPVAPPVNKVARDQDFTFAASESLMTPASLRELSEPFTPIEPTPVEIAIQPEAVADPVAEVQRMYEDEEPAPSYEDDVSPYSQPNLHVVSDQTSSAQDEEEEGFSGAVRSALRSIIKEQVSHWLHDNMTDLIEDALSGPSKPARQAPARKTKPIRRDK